jgi:multimeric flavodoxin WrbA
MAQSTAFTILGVNNSTRRNNFMNILVILGSPRKKGNSETLAQTVISGIEERKSCTVEYVYVHGLKLSPCLGCGGCEKTGNCVVKDDLTELYEKVDQADVVFLVTPVYFYGPSAQIKTFIDRFQARWSRKYLLNHTHRPEENRKGYLIATAATKGQKVFESCSLIAKSYFDTIDLEYGGEFLVRSVDERGAIKKKEDELKDAIIFGRNIAAT